MYYACLCVRADHSVSTTLSHSAQGKPMLLCADHARDHRDGYSFIIYPVKETQRVR